MAKSCSLIKNPNGSGYTPESLELLYTDIYSFVNNEMDKIQWAANGRYDLVSTAINRALARIGDKWNNSQIKELSNQVQEAFTAVFPNLLSFLPESIENQLSKKYRTVVHFSLDDNTTDLFDGEIELQKETASSFFIDRIFGNKINMRNAMKFEAARNILNCFIINRKTGEIIGNEEDANKKVREYKNELYKTVIDYLNQYENTNILTNVLFDDTGEVNSDYNSVKRYFLKLNKLNPDLLLSLYDLSLNGEDHGKYKAFLSSYILENFDNLLEYLFPNVINIHPEHKGRIVSGDGYSFSRKGAFMRDNWTNKEDPDITTQIGHLTQWLIKTTPALHYNIDNENGQYVDFKDFVNLINKIKNIPFNNKDIIFKYLPNDPSSQFVNQLGISNQSLFGLINNFRNNPLQNLPIVFQALYHSNLLLALGFSQEEMNTFYSIYKGLFDGENSILSIQQKYNSLLNNIYGLMTQSITTLSENALYQYNQYDGQITVREMHDQSLAKIRRNIEDVIYTTNTRRTALSNYDNIIKKYDIKEVGQGFEGIQLSIDLGNNLKLTIISKLNGEVNNYLNQNNVTITNLQKNELYNSNEFFKYIDSILGTNIAMNSTYKLNLLLEYNNSKDAVVTALLKLVGQVELNKYISNHLLKDVKGRNATLTKLKEIYAKQDDRRPGFNNTLFEMKLLNDSTIPDLEKLARAQNATYGNLDSLQVKDAEGNQLSTKVLSRLLGNILPQWQRIKDNNGLAKDFSIMLDDFFKGVASMKELNTPTSNKERSKFTVAESLLGSFLYEFVGGLTPKTNVNGNLVIGNKIIGLLPSVNSDKDTMGVTRWDLNVEVKVDDPSLYIGKRKKQYHELNSNDIELVISKELGQYYSRLYDKVYDDFLKLSTATGVNIDFENGFINFNKEAKNYGGGVAYLQQLTLQYNNSNKHDPIHIIDLLHYVKNGNNLNVNTTLLTLRKRFSDRKYLSHFLTLKRGEFLKTMMDENFQIVLTGDEVNDNTMTAKLYLASTHPDWVGSTDMYGADVHNGKMTIAKITYNDKTWKITNKNDLYNFYVSTGESSTADIDFHALMTDPRFHVELHPLLDKYNLFDYLLTQEFMIAGVGTHIIHPIKVTGKIKKNINNLLSKNGGLYRNIAVKFVDSLEPTPGRIDPVAARVVTDLDGRKTIFIVKELMQDKFIAKTWINQPTLSDGTVAQALPENIFDTFEDFLFFTLEHEYQHSKVLRLPNETIGLYETRVNNAALGVFEYVKYDNDEMMEEAFRFLAQMKRNVSYTAQMYDFLLNQFDGITTYYNVSVLPDIKSDVYNIAGDAKSAKPFDGSTFVHPCVNFWENNSLQEAKAGNVKKQFVHFYDESTGTAGIIKTAGFPLTNDLMKSHTMYRTMMQNMTDRAWVDEKGLPLMLRENAFLVNYEGLRVDYGMFYFKNGIDPTTGEAQYVERIITGFDAATQEFIVSDVIIDKTGWPQSQETTNRIHVKSNFDIYSKLFGGWDSMEMTDDGLQRSELSIHLMSKALNSYGWLKPGKQRALTAEDVVLPLKHQDIHYIVTEGAMKQGIANINSVNAYYNKQDLNFMRVKMMQAGILLDKEHHANQSHLSLFTLVISAACARGYTQEQAKKLYDMLYNLTAMNTKDFRDLAGRLLGFNSEKISKDNATNDAINNAAAALVMRNLLLSGGEDNNAMKTLTMNLITELKGNIKVSEELRRKLDNALPYSNPEVFNKLVTIVTSTLTKDAIKIKMPGSLSVLNPTHDIVKLYKVPGINGPRYIFYGQLEDEGYDLDQLQEQAMTKLVFLPDIEMGLKYLVTRTDGSQYVAHVTMPHKYRGKYTGPVTTFRGNVMEVHKIGYLELKNEMASGNIMSINEWVKDGNDLQSYNVKFSDNFGQRYQIADLAIVQDYFDLVNTDKNEKLDKIYNILNQYNIKQTLDQLIDLDLKSVYNHGRLTQLLIEKKGCIDYILSEINAGNKSIAEIILQNKRTINKNWNTTTELLEALLIKLGSGIINRELLNTLNSLSNNSLNNTVMIINKNNQREIVSVDKNTVDTKAFGIIMPKVFKSNFGLEEFDSVADIKDDPEFFIKRIVKRLTTKSQNYPDDNGNIIMPYHVELKKANGDHIYIREGLTNSGMDASDEVELPRYTDNKGNTYILESDNKTVRYQLFDANDKVYEDSNGNQIIVTSEEGIKFYMDRNSYLTIGLNKDLNDELLNKYIEIAASSKNKNAKRFAKQVQNYIANVEQKRKSKSLRNLIQSLNNYESILNNDQEGTILNDYRKQMLRQLGEEMHTSFLKSLDIIAARIPAQSLQSFMAMEVQGFENPDLNNAYVSVFLFYLLGSKKFIYSFQK